MDTKLNINNKRPSDESGQTLFEQDLISVLVKLTPQQRVEYITQHGEARDLSVMADPLLIVQWREEAFTAAQANGPHQDALNNPDPRTIESVEDFLVAAGGKHHAVGLLQFQDPTVLIKALKDLLRQRPWAKWKDPSHAAVADGTIAHSCMQVDCSGRKFGFVPNAMFEI